MFQVAAVRPATTLDPSQILTIVHRFGCAITDVLSKHRLWTFSFKKIMIFVLSAKWVRCTLWQKRCVFQTTSWIARFFSCPEQLNRWPCHSLTQSVTDSLRTLLLDRKRATLETCDLWDIWSEWWGDMTWLRKTYKIQKIWKFSKSLRIFWNS